MLSVLALTSFLAAAQPGLARVPPPARLSALGLPAELTENRLQALLQSFVDTGYGVRFRRLGDESDFDHGHVLLDAATGAPLAILYHTQELAGATPGGESLLGPDGRNWIQWLDGRVENARRYERARYPRSADWDWFVARQLPKLRARGTISDRMLDPVRLGAAAERSVQWTFTRRSCAGTSEIAAPGVLRVVLPDRTPVCLALSVQ